MTKQEKFDLVNAIKSRVDERVQEFNARLQKEIEDLLDEYNLLSH